MFSVYLSCYLRIYVQGYGWVWEARMEASMSSAAAFEQWVCVLCKALDKPLTSIYSYLVFMLSLKCRELTQIWRARNALLTFSEQSNVNTPAPHKRLVPLWRNLSFIQRNLPFEDLVERASVPSRKLFIVYTLWASQTFVVDGAATWSVSRYDMKIDKSIAWRLLSQSRYVIADMHFPDRIRFQDISNVFCLLILCLNIACSNLFLRMVSSGKPVSIFIGDEWLTRPGSVFMFSIRRAKNKDVGVNLWKDVLSSPRPKCLAEVLYKDYLCKSSASSLIVTLDMTFFHMLAVVYLLPVLNPGSSRHDKQCFDMGGEHNI